MIPTWLWIVIAVWFVVTVTVIYMLDRATRHAPRDPSDQSEDFVPVQWSWPERTEDRSEVRHGGLGR